MVRLVICGVGFAVFWVDMLDVGVVDVQPAIKIHAIGKINKNILFTWVSDLFNVIN